MPAAAKKKPAPTFDYRVHKNAGTTTVKVSAITRELLRQTAEAMRTRDGHYYHHFDVNEVIFHLATGYLGKK